MPQLPTLRLAAAAMPPPLHLAVAATSALGVALGVRLLVVLSRSSALKPLAAATSAAVAALRAPRVVASATSPISALLAASKAATKSYKAARTLGSRLPSLPSSKLLKAAFATASLLRLAATAAPIPAASPAGVAVLAVLKSGYKLSKNSYKIVEGFLGLQVHKGFRNGVDALGVVVKVAVIASEVAVWAGVQWWGGGRGRCVRFLSFSRPTSLVLVGCSRSQPQAVLLEPELVDMDGGEGYQLEQRGASELLSLAVPVPQARAISGLHKDRCTAAHLHWRHRFSNGPWEFYLAELLYAGLVSNRWVICCFWKAINRRKEVVVEVMLLLLLKEGRESGVEGG
ncbi:hypothetical protein EJB05_08087, partial [Eragrostis curvula]